ncbi:hypothetical protein C8T65DRAFT_656101 [Cerioporus squamosus]|nr:hypothetical protein C8T65DRAFT_656101 [Cerioporus squamosus]
MSTVRSSTPLSMLSIRRFLRKRRSVAEVDVPLPVTTLARLSLCSLPTEVLACILCLCEIAEIFSCSLVCRSLEYLILLDVNGMIDGPSSHLPVSERLHRLKIYTFQSRNGPDAFTRAPGLPHWHRTPENKDWTLSLSFSSSISYILTKPRLGLVEIISPASDFQSATHHWVVPLTLFPGSTVLAVSADIVQDLLLVLQAGTDSSQILVHVRSLRHPDVGHPSAMLSVLHTVALRPESADSIQIHKDRVAWSLSYDRGQSHDIEVWDWKSGVLVWRSRFHAQVSFALLDESRIVAGCHGWNELRVYHVAPEATSNDLTFIAALGRDHFVSLRLPGGSKLKRIQESTIPSPPADVPFWPNPSLRMITVGLDDSAASSRQKHFPVGLLIPFETLQSILALHAASRTRVQWDAWGPRRSLLLYVSTSYHYLGRNFVKSQSFGSRLAVPLTHHGSWMPGGIAVIDINPYAARYSRNPHLRGTWEAELPRYLDLKSYFGTESAALPHVIHYVAGLNVRGTGTVAADPYGFTIVSATDCRFEHESKGIKSYTVNTAMEGLWRH